MNGLAERSGRGPVQLVQNKFFIPDRLAQAQGTPILHSFAMFLVLFGPTPMTRDNRVAPSARRGLIASAVANMLNSTRSRKRHGRLRGAADYFASTPSASARLSIVYGFSSSLNSPSRMSATDST